MKNFFLLFTILIGLSSWSYGQHRNQTKLHWRINSQVGNYPVNNYQVYPSQGNCNSNAYHGNPGRGISCGTSSQVYMNTISDHEFGYVMDAIYSQTFDDGKLGVANQMLSSNYLFSWQVKEIMSAFTFDSSRLKFAKRAYSNTLDQNNYYIVNSAFTFSSSARELSESICRY